MKIIGITGASGAGKSTLVKLFNLPVVDADKCAREVTEKGHECLKKLAEVFGADILFSDGTLDRKLLARKAFASEEKTALLNAVTHPFIVEKMKKLYSLKKQKHEKFELANDGVAYRIFDFAKENNLIVCFDFEDDCRRGFVQRYEENICIIKTVTDYSEPDGEAIIDIDQANSISLDTDFEQDLKLVFESRN